MSIPSIAPEPAGRSAAARDRLVAGLAASIKERGYRETKISDIVAHARTSRRTFYEVFATKDDCFFALLRDLNRLMVEHISAAVDPQAPWDVQIRVGVTAWVEWIAAQPEIGISWIREFPSLGPRANDAHREGMEELTRMLQALTDSEQMRRGGVQPVSRERAAIVLGGLRELAAAAAESGGDLQAVTEEAVTAALALLGPVRSDRRPRRGR